MVEPMPRPLLAVSLGGLYQVGEDATEESERGIDIVDLNGRGDMAMLKLVPQFSSPSKYLDFRR